VLLVYPDRSDVLIVQYEDAQHNPKGLWREIGSERVRCVLPYRPLGTTFYVRFRTTLKAPHAPPPSDLQLPGANVFTFVEYAKREFDRNASLRKKRSSWCAPVASSAVRARGPSTAALGSSTPHTGSLLRGALLTAAGFAAGYWFAKRQ
jgi:hypothetical protein